MYLAAQPTRDEIDHDAKQAVIDMRKSDLAIIDDLGTEDRIYTEFFKEQFKMSLDEHQGRMVITSNLSRPQMEAKLNDKIVSRIFENCRTITLRGKDYRRSNG